MNYQLSVLMAWPVSIGSSGECQLIESHITELAGPVLAPSDGRKEGAWERAKSKEGMAQMELGGLDWIGWTVITGSQGVE